MNHIPLTFVPILDAWKSPQLGLPKVIGWKKYIIKEEGARPQNSLQHSHALAVLGAIVIAKLAKFTELDSGLLMTAFTVHDIGEGEIGYDTLYLDKTEDGNVSEYRAFKKRYRRLGGAGFEALEKAFLLQFALKENDGLPEKAKKIIRELPK